MLLTINGQKKEITGVSTLNAVISQSCKDAGRVIAELNGTIIKKPAWDTTPVNEGDSIELVSFVGGG